MNCSCFSCIPSLSPIIEQSPCDESVVSQLVPSSQRHGTIVGEGLATAQLCLTTSSITMVQPPPPAVLSFRDQTVCPIDSSVPRTTGPGWDVYMSPEQPPKQASLISKQPQSSVRPRHEPFTIIEDQPTSPERAQEQVDVPMTPECALKSDWLAIGSPDVPVEPDLDAFLSPCRPNKSVDVPMSPEEPQLCPNVPMSPGLPQQFSTVDESMMSPDRGPKADVSMNAAPTPGRMAAVQLVSDPWNDELISGLLSALTPPLTAHPRCITWQCNVPNISPKTTISMGEEHS